MAKKTKTAKKTTTTKARERRPAPRNCRAAIPRVVILTSEQASALVATVAEAIDAFGPPPPHLERHLLTAIDSLDRTFGLGIVD